MKTFTLTLANNQIDSPKETFNNFNKNKTMNRIFTSLEQLKKSFANKGIYVLFVLFVMGLSLNGLGQTHNLPATGSNSWTTCSGTLYDNGGTGNYSNSCSGYTTIYPATAGNKVRLTGSFITESGYDYVTIFNGAGTGGTVLYAATSGTVTIPTITSTSADGSLTVRLTSDGSVVYAGIIFTVSCVTPEMTVPASGSNSYTTCSGHLYDNGGSGGNYGNSQDGYTIIYPGNTSQAVQLTGSYVTESCCEHIYIYNGAGTGGTLLYNGGNGTGSIGTITSSGANIPLTVRFTSDGSVTYSGFDFTISCVTPCTPSAQGVYGTNSWLSYGYNGQDLNTYLGRISGITQSWNNLNGQWGSGGATCECGTTNTDLFSTRHMMNYNFTGGIYAISYNTDDGVRISTNGGSSWNIVNAWDNATHSGTEYVYLNGSTNIIADQRENTGGAGINVTIVPQCYISAPTYGTNVWNTYAYNGQDLNTFYGQITGVTNTWNNLNCQWGSGAPSTNCLVMPSDYFSTRSMMNYNFTAGFYTVTYSSDDGIRLSFDGGSTWPVNYWDNTTHSGTYTVYLSGNSYLIADQRENTGGAAISVSISNPAMVVPSSGNNSYSVCSGNLYDSGGPSGNYGDSWNGYTVLNPATPGAMIQISGTSSGEACCDRVLVYNGSGTSGTLLGTYYMNTAIPTLVSSDPSGALTVQFISDGSVTGAGFDLSISCILCVSCPSYNAQITPTNTYQTVSGTIATGGCKKYRVDMTAGLQYEFTFCSGGGTASYDTYLTLFDASCSTTASNDDYCGLLSQLTYTAPSTGTYYLEVNSCCTGGSGGTYTLAYRSVCTTPGVPLSLSGSGTGLSTANISWAVGSPAGSSTVTYYWEVYTSGGTLAQSGNTTGTSATVSGLVCNTSYYFRVRAYTSCDATYSSWSGNSGTFSTSAISAPSPVTANPTSICPGTTSNLNATSAGNTINWYTQASGGSAIGSSASGVNYAVSPSSTTTYYAEAYTGGTSGNMLGTPVHINSGSGSYTLGQSFTPNTNITVTAFRRYFGSKISIWDNSGTLLVSQAVSGTDGSWTQTNLSTPVNLSAGVTYRIGAYTNGSNYYWRTDLGNTFAHGTINTSYEISGDAFPTTADAVLWWFVDMVYTTGAPCASARTSVTVNAAVPSAPVSVTASPSTICNGSSSNLNATSSGNTIYWYTQASGGSSIGNSSSGSNYNVNPSSTTTYYAEALMNSGTQSTDFNFTGSEQTWVVPAGVTSIFIEAWGAEGGGQRLSGNTASGYGGRGGYSTGTLSVTPGQTLYLYVGGYGASSTSGIAAGGWNGGGSGYASSSGEPGNGGGGATDVRVGGNTYSNRVIVAGGGGGGGEDSGDTYGHGGGLSGTGYAGYDGTQTTAGPGGGFGYGGTTNMGDGGGGGGGWYGGGTTSSGSVGTDTQGGGGGSGYTDGVTSGTTTANIREGNGLIRITYDASCVSANRTSVTVTPLASGSWLGSTSNDWHNSANWCLGGSVPNSTTDVIIPDAGLTSNDPNVIILNTGYCRDLTINSNAILNLTGNLHIYGNWTNNGTFNENNSNVIFDGNNPKQINSNETFYFLSLQGTSTLTLNAPVNVSGGLALINGTLINNNNLTMGNNSMITRAENSSLNAAPNFAGTISVTYIGGPLTTGYELPTNTSILTFLNLQPGAVDKIITLNAPLTVNTQLNLSSAGAVLRTSNTNLLTLADGATVFGASNTRFVDGPVSKIGDDAFEFPTGDVVGTTYVWAPIAMADPGGNVNDRFTAEYFLQPAPYNWAAGDMCNVQDMNHVSGVEYWEMTRNSGSTYPDLTLYWKDANRSGITDVSQLCVGHRETCTGGQTGWTRMSGTASGSTGVGGTGSATATGFTSYSPITFGTKNNNNPLPVQLLSFNASCNDNTVIVHWSTATELNNDFFTVERSADGLNWELAGKVNGNGNSNHVLNYSFSDNKPYEGTSYYRLKQTDFDGKSETFNPVSVECSGSDLSANVSYFPNPFTSEVIVSLNNISSSKAMIVVYDMLGSKVFEKHFTENELSTGKLSLKLNDLASGVYYIEFKSDNFSKTNKVIKSY